MRIGIGHDIHRLVPGRPLILGGVEIAYPMGLWGHSDADVLCHAVSDALLGAAALGDIGQHFPNTDPAWKDASSLKLLGIVWAMLKNRGWRLENVDSMILAEKPKLAPFLPQMRQNLASVLGVPSDRISIKAGTNETVDAVGREEAIVCHAVVLIESSTAR